MFKHALGGGIRNLLRSFWLSITAISVLTASLFLVALFAFVTTAIGFYLRTFDKSVAITVFYKQDVERKTIDVMIEDLKTLPEVSTVTFQDRKQVQDDFRSKDGVLGETIDNLIANDLQVGLENITVTPSSAEDYESVVSVVNSSKYTDIINETKGSNGFASKLRDYHYKVNLGGTIMVVICALVSILVMVNILRIAIYQRKNEIEIMRLVGATNGYIRGPFIAEGLYYNLVASFIVAIAFVFMMKYGLDAVSNYIGINTIDKNEV
jgi:cell division transport system permease protein